MQPDSVMVRGQSGDWKDPEKLVALIQDDAWDTSIERRDAGSDELVTFTLRAKR